MPTIDIALSALCDKFLLEDKTFVDVAQQINDLYSGYGDMGFEEIPSWDLWVVASLRSDTSILVFYILLLYDKSWIHFSPMM